MTRFSPLRKDPHKFSLDLPVVLRLKKKLALRKKAKLMRKLQHQRVAIIPTYTHVQECEAELLQKFDVQSTPLTVDYDNLEIGMLTINLLVLVSDEKTWSSPARLASALNLYITSVTKKNTISMCQWVIEKCLEFRATFQLSLQSEEEDENPIFAQMRKVSNPFTNIRTIFQKWSLVKSHPLVKKLMSMLHHILAASLLEKFGITYETFFFSKAEKEASIRAHGSKLGLVETVLDGASYILERLWDCACTGHWSPFMHTGDNYGKWVDSVYAIKEQSFMLHAPEANGFKLHQFVADLDKAIEQGDLILKYSVDLDPSVRIAAKKLLSELRLLKGEQLTREFARAQREAPFGVLFFGGSGLGKSTLISAFQSYFAKIFSLPEGDQYSYTRSFEDEYYSGFTSSMWSIILDDVAARNPNMKDDKSINEIITLMNNVCYCPPQADLADKGKTPVRAKLVIATTNVKHLNAHAYFCSTLAIRRRLPYIITPVVLPEYSVDPEVPEYDRMLDSAKVKVEGALPNLWKFKVEKVGALPGTQEDMPQSAQLSPVSPPEGWDIYEMLKYLGKEAKKHFANQDMMLRSRNELREMPVCNVCLEVGERCQCQGDIQSDFSWDIPWYWFVGLVAFHYVRMNIELWMNKIVCFTFWWIYRMITAQIRARWNRMVFWTFRKEDVLTRVRATLENTAESAKDMLKFEHEQIREAFVKAGEKIRMLNLTHRRLAAFVAALPVVYLTYKTVKAWKDLEIQGSTLEGERIESKDEKPNVWVRDEYEPKSFETGSLTKSWKTLPFEDIADKVGRNVIHLTARYTDNGIPKKQVCRALGLRGNLYVTTNHSLNPNHELMVTVVTSKAVDGIGGNFTIKIVQKQLFRLPEEDLVFFRLGNMPPVKNIVELLAEDTFRTVCKGTKLYTDENGTRRQLAASGIHYVLSNLGAPIHSIIKGWKATSPVDTENGDCGVPLLGMAQQGPVILGLHQQGGRGNVNVSIMLNKHHYMMAVDHFGTFEIAANAPYLKDVNDVQVEVQGVHHKSPVRYINEGTANVYGSFTGFRPSHKSQVTDTFIRKEMEELGHKVKTGAPVMKGWEPWHAAIKDIVQQDFTADQSIIDECADAFAEDILAGLSAQDLKELVILDDMSTINGIPGVKYIDKMKRNTSMGWPWRSKKSNFMSEPHAFEVWNDAVDFDDAFYERVNRIIERYEAGERHMPVYTGHLKDEPTKFSKIESKLTRVFCGAPADWSFVVRKYLLTFVRVMQNNKFLFEAAPGTNAVSYEWEDMYDYLTKFNSNHLIAGDFSKFDKNMSAQWIMAAYRVIDAILKKAGWSEKDRRAVQCIGVDTAFPLCDMNGDVIEFWGSNPSGQPLTVIINCLVNSLYMRYVWKKCGEDLKQFKAYVALMTYGDDNVMDVHQDKPNFNHTSIQRELGKIGIKYTMADKETESVPYITISDVSFLKREWRWHHELHTYVAAIEEDSISKMLTKCVPSKVLCPEAHAVTVMSCALREYFLYGRPTFEKWRSSFLEVIAKKNLSPFYTTEFPTYLQLIKEYESTDPERAAEKAEWAKE